MSGTVKIVINGVTKEVPKDVNILEACRQSGVYVPTLCYHHDLPAAGHCGLCVVKVDGKAHAYACMTQVKPDMVISTTDADVIAKAQQAFDLFMDMAHPPKSQDIEEVMNYLSEKKHVVVRPAERTAAITFDPQECIKCNRCVRMCADVIDIGALDDPTMGIKNSPCISCGQCTSVCPTGALIETKSVSSILRALATQKVLVAIVDPSAMVGINAVFDKTRPGFDASKKIVAALKSTGFKYVFDLRSAIDIVTAELAEEMLSRNSKPFIPATCPSLVNFMEKTRSEAVKHLSKIKSPGQVLGEILRGSWAASQKLKAENVFIVEVTGCVASKDEAQRMQLKGCVDASITTRELADLIKQFGIDWKTVGVGSFNEPFNIASAPATLTSLSGGWAQSILKYLAEKEGQRVEDYKFEAAESGMTKAEVQIGRKKLSVVVCDGMSAANQLLASSAWNTYDIIDISVCPGGCAYGGGQPKLQSRSHADERSQSLNDMAKRSSYKSSFSAVSQIQKSLAIGEKLKKGFVTHYEPHESAQFMNKKRSADTPLVAYGSTGGKATRYARLVASFVHASSQSMNSVSVSDIAFKKTVIIIISTYGKGEYPANAKRFAAQLEACKDDMKGVSFAVLGLGRSSAGDNFCLAGKKIHDMFESRGARPILPFTRVDSLDSDGGDNAYAIWSNDLATALYMKKPKVGLELVNKFEVCEDKSVVDVPSRPIGYEMAEIVEANLMSPEGYVPSMHKYTLKLPDGMTYEVGDHVVILPENDKPIVDRILSKLGYDENAVFSHDSNDPIIPHKVSVRQLLTQYINLNGLPPIGLLIAFQNAANEEGKAKLSKLTDESNPDALNEYLSDINVAEFIDEFAQYGVPPLDAFVSTAPHMTGRLYSIASAPDANRGFLDIMVLDAVWGENNKRHGLCTHYLATPGLKRIAIHCKKGKFKYPADTTTPIIMVGLGAGVSPMFSLIQFRQTTDKPLGPAYLFFGAKYQAGFPLLMKKLKNFHDTKVVNELYTAFSRDGPKKVYVQDLMKKNSSKLWDLWQDHRTQFYYCGPKRGIPDQLKEIMLELTINEGYLSREEAMAYNSRHEWIIEES